MGTWDSYKPERRMGWEDIAQAIRSTVTMDDILPVFAPSTPRKHRRCPCPIHNGKDYNFSYTDNGYRCFVCGASGDVIAFVKELHGLSTRAEAMQQINDAFHLGLDFHAEMNAEVRAEVNKRRAEAERKKQESQAWWDEYHRLWDEWIRLDQIRSTAHPMSALYAKAVKNIDTIAYQIDSLPPEPR